MKIINVLADIICVSVIKIVISVTYDDWACGAMDNASDYGSEDSRFDSWQARIFSPILDCGCILMHKYCVSTLLSVQITLLRNITNINQLAHMRMARHVGLA